MNIDSGFIIYENKNDQELKEFLIEKDVKMWDNIKKRCNKIINMKEMPKIPAKHEKWCGCLAYKESKGSADI